jgi:DNA-binding CsgD family transcriptional regulator
MTPAGRLFLRSLKLKERRILVLICAGLSNGRIADRVGTSEQCIKNCMRVILGKAARRNRHELTLFAFRNFVVECPCQAACRMEIEQRVGKGSSQEKTPALKGRRAPAR